MRLLLDTQIVYWFYYEKRNVPQRAYDLMNEAQTVFVSAASVWEMAIKVRIGKLNANPRQMTQLMEAAGFDELPVFSRHTMQVADMPLHHADPFDRLLVAQAVSEQLNLVTTDALLKQYSSLVIEV